MLKIILVFIAPMILMLAPCVQAGGNDVALYLGPRPGIKLHFEYKNGIRSERAAFSGDQKSVLIEERSYYPPEITPTGEPMTGTSTYKLSAEDNRLIQVRDIEIIILDLGKGEWTAPAGGPGEVPSVMQCRVESQGKEMILGKELKAVEALCSYTTKGVQLDTKYTLAENLGIVRLSISSGEKIFKEMHLVKIEEEFWMTGDKPRK